MAAHTPGPWQEGPTDGTGQRGKLIVVDSNGLKVANCEADRSDDRLSFLRPLPEDTANARLIAAAPDLLKALKDLHRNVDRDLSGYWTESTSNFMQQAEAAIAKAEGRS